jgi:hypothetical protein
MAYVVIIKIVSLSTDQFFMFMGAMTCPKMINSALEAVRQIEAQIDSCGWKCSKVCYRISLKFWLHDEIVLLSRVLL